MAKHLTDKQRKRINADYRELGSLNAVAKLHGVSRQTVKNIVMQDTEIGQKLQQKKEQNTADILAYMESKKTDVCLIIEKYLEEMTDEEKLKKTPLNQIATSLGIIIDKFTSDKMESGASGVKNNLVKILKESSKQ